MDDQTAPNVEEQMEEDLVTSKKPRHRKKQLYKDIRKQMEFYFSEANLTKDRFLGNLTMVHPEVDITVFLRFNRIRAMTTDVRDIANALRNSDLLSVTEDGTKIFRKVSLKPKENTDDCTIYVEQLPPDAQHDWLRDVFSAYGKVSYVSIPKYRTSGKIKGFAFVEFETPEEANKTLEAFGAMGCRLSTQIAPEKLCSIATYEPDEGKSEEIPDKEDKKETNEDETNQSLDSSSKKKKKRKKKMEETKTDEEDCDIQSSDVAEALPKKKRKSEDAEEKLNTVVDEGTDIVEPQSRKKKRKREQDTAEELEENKVDSSSDTETQPEKKKRKKRSEDGEEPASNTENAEIQDENKTSENENVPVEGEEEMVESSTGKKKRKRRKQHKRKKQDVEASRLQILSKKEWKRLRNKYLELQKTKMKSLKHYLNKNKWNRNAGGFRSHYANGNALEKEEHGEESRLTEATAVKQETDSKPRISFTPGVLVRASLDEPIVDVRKFKAEAITMPDVQYVDVMMGANEAIIRCATSSGAENVVANAPWQQSEILKGQEEKNYWDKIFHDREQKFSNKIRVKQRGREKILRRAERELGKHIRFDD